MKFSFSPSLDGRKRNGNAFKKIISIKIKVPKLFHMSQEMIRLISTLGSTIWIKPNYLQLHYRRDTGKKRSLASQ